MFLSYDRMSVDSGKCDYNEVSFKDSTVYTKKAHCIQLLVSFLLSYGLLKFYI